MNARKPGSNLLNPIEQRMLSINEASVYLGIGRSTAIQFLQEIGAKRKIGKRSLYDKNVIDEYLNNKNN